MTRNGPPILKDPAKYTGCLTCELRCSLRFEKAFNPILAAIKIRRLVGQDREYDIMFTQRCDNCGICAHYCPYGTLVSMGFHKTLLRDFCLPPHLKEAKIRLNEVVVVV